MQDRAWRKLERLEVGGGRVSDVPGATRLELPALRQGYADAQLDDYRRLPRSRFPWRPPLCLRLRARASRAAPTGTLGFGFWNDPFTFSLGQGATPGRLPASPTALWFFNGSPPHDLAFLDNVAGSGWKAACLRSRKVLPLFVALGAPFALLLSRLPWTRALAVRQARRMIQAQEAVLSGGLEAWHTYEIAWHIREASFRVDGQVVLVASDPPPGPLGFVAWIDNQFAVLSPERGIHFGVLPCAERQWLEIADLDIHALPASPGAA
jgi:hypothetical protein